MAVSLSDIEDPRIQCPANLIVINTFNKTTGIAIWTGPEAFDNSGLSPNISCSMKSGSQFAFGQTEVICQAYDGSENRAECTFTVEVTGKYILCVNLNKGFSRGNKYYVVYGAYENVTKIQRC